MKKDLLYWFFVRGLDWFVWRGSILNPEDLPTESPVVFIANHTNALGPIAVVSSLPVRVYPWVISDMMERDKAARYLCYDFVEPQLHISPPFSMPISRLLSQASVRLFRVIDAIPVWQGDGLLKTYQWSMKALVQRKSLLIFPENPKLVMNELFMMTPFEKSFARLGNLYFTETGKILYFIPLAVHPLKRQIRIGKGIPYNPNNEPVLECIRIKRVLEAIIHDLYFNFTLDGCTGIPSPH